MRTTAWLSRLSFPVFIFFACTPIASGQRVLDAPLFTPAEIQTHRLKIKVITDAATSCLVDTYADHVRFFNRWHVSKYYGNRRPEHATDELRRAQLKKFGAPEFLAAELEPVSCIGLTVECLGRGFAAAGLSPTWQKIYQRLAANNRFLGTDLQVMLMQLGWSSLYWNPDPSQNAAWDLEDRKLNPLRPGRKWMPVWGGHVVRYASVRKHGLYDGIPVQDAFSLVGFGRGKAAALQHVPFFVGTAHAGYHVFPGFAGNVIEGHSARALNDFKTLEVSEFNPIVGGGPKWTRSEHYRSGLIVIPPRPRRVFAETSR